MLVYIHNVIPSLGNNNVMVILDNHITTPGHGVSGKRHYDIIFHPASNLCVSEVVGLSPCQDIAPWSYNNIEKTIRVEGIDFYLEVVGPGEPAD
ncbi:hypothetical protein IFM89_039228 [Coptis chinensis]|uniref:Uncharacterized protein n=1 Tax=Coptis chinensis TaxID=261450 RepID=A0A835M3N4_9MAGN|nr:hypothetical protein IFM89_039228 [Coptis chinensis]